MRKCGGMQRDRRMHDRLSPEQVKKLWLRYSQPRGTVQCRLGTMLSTSSCFWKDILGLAFNNLCRRKSAHDTSPKNRNSQYLTPNEIARLVEKALGSSLLLFAQIRHLLGVEYRLILRPEVRGFSASAFEVLQAAPNLLDETLCLPVFLQRLLSLPDLFQLKELCVMVAECG